MIYLLLLLRALIVLVGPLALGWWLRRRLDTRWSTWGWGALAFVGSQLFRLPLLALITVLSNQAGFTPDPDVSFWINLMLLTVTAGLFEETARYVVLRWLAKGARGWNSAVMFGAGHGGIEAILLVGLTAISNIVLLSIGDTLLAQLETTSPEQVEALAAQLETIRNLDWWLPLLALWERVLALTFHIAASILVMRAVQARQAVWWGAAVLFHTAFNAVALIALKYGGLVTTEVALSFFTLLAVYIIKTQDTVQEQPEEQES